MSICDLFIVALITATKDVTFVGRPFRRWRLLLIIVVRSVVIMVRVLGI